VNVIVTVGVNGNPDALHPLPNNARVERYIPQSLLFSRIDLVISHGGSGTMLSALGHWLPQLFIPQGADQLRNAELCVASGACRALLAADFQPDDVRREVRELLSAPAYRGRANELKQEIYRMPAPEQVVERLEALA